MGPHRRVGSVVGLALLVGSAALARAVLDAGVQAVLPNILGSIGAFLAWFVSAEAPPVPAHLQLAGTLLGLLILTVRFVTWQVRVRQPVRVGGCVSEPRPEPADEARVAARSYKTRREQPNASTQAFLAGHPEHSLQTPEEKKARDLALREHDRVLEEFAWAVRQVDVQYRREMNKSRAYRYR